MRVPIGRGVVVGLGVTILDAQGDAAVMLLGFDVRPCCGVVSESNRARLRP